MATENTARDLETRGDVRTEEMLLNMGPQHPSTHGVFRVVIRTDGEMVLESQSHIGYLHRCFEKCAEGNNYIQVVPYTDRMDYLCAMTNNLGYAETVETLRGLPVPERAQYIRVIAAELNRIASHLMAFGTYGLDLGAISAFLSAFRDRERILKVFEKICGQRLNYSYVRIGGVTFDITDEIVRDISEFVEYFDPRIIDEYNRLLSYNGIFISRTANVGVLPAELAISHGVTGPSLRGSGVKRDLRKDEPYSIYERFDFDIPVGSGKMGTVGDCWDRYMVRIREMHESCEILRQALGDIPGGPFCDKKAFRQVKPPKGEVYHKIEGARGELGFYLVSDGTTTPYRCKARGPSFCNISVLDAITARGDCMLADIVAIIGSFDIVMGEVDR
ncbi:MAG: NADH-quinone oxidoreductase subunit D [Planctomycetota bacterium]|nr:NADH-quinone oxidoreductase subunit D [Planctomycetota bacterium]